MVKKRPLPSPLPLLDERFLLDELDRAGIAEVWGYRVWYAAIKYVLSQPRDVPLEQFSIQEAVKCMVHSPPKGLAEILTKFAIFTSRISVEQRSSDGTIKLAVQLHDGLTVEAVLIPHHGESRQRVTLCVSSQVGVSPILQMLTFFGCTAGSHCARHLPAVCHGMQFLLDWYHGPQWKSQ
jgi:hypothetical protein